MVVLFHRMFDKLKIYSTVPLELLTAMQAIIWGLWLLIPFDTFSINPVYREMRNVLPEHIWGIFFLGLGTVQAICIHTNCKLRRVVATTMFYSWVAVDILFWASKSWSAAPITYITLVVASGWVALSMAHRDKERSG